MSTIRIPYFAVRENKTSGPTYRFLPGPKLRKAGLKSFIYAEGGRPLTPALWGQRGFTMAQLDGLDLHGLTDDGTPMPLHRAMACAQSIAIAAGRRTAPAAKRRAPQYTVCDMLGAALSVMQTDLKRGKIKAVTIDGYRWAMTPLRTHIGTVLARDLSAHSLKEVYQIAQPLHGERMALYMMQTIRRSINLCAALPDWDGHLPLINWKGVQLEAQKRRKRMMTAPEFAALILAAQDPAAIEGLSLGHKSERGDHALQPLSSVADAIILGMGTAQRITDLVQIRADQIKDGRLTLTQSKHASQIDMPLLPAVRARIGAIIAGHSLANYDSAEGPLLRADHNGRPYAEYADPVKAFSKRFAIVRARAALICPSVTDLVFKDIRRTSIQALFDSGNAMEDVRVISGHSLKSMAQIMDHYAPGSPRQADRVIALAARDDQGLFARLADHS